MANNTPEVRFEGFSGEWEERKLIDVKDTTDKYSYTGGPFGSDLKSSDYTKTGIRIIQLQNIGDGEFLDDYKIYTSKEKAESLKSNLIYPGEVIIAKMAHPLARATIMPNLESKYLMASDGIRLKVDSKKFNIYYILTLINSEKFRKEAINNSTGTTRKRIGLVTLGNLPMQIPNIEEQTKIGTFFKQLDDTIALQQQELDILKQTKQGFLQKMFPKKGETVPEIRFPGFSGEWEERKLGEHSEILTGGTPKTSITSYWEPKEVPWMSSGEVNKHRLDSTDNMISLEGLKNSSARWVKPYSILIALAGQGKTRGTVAINNVAITTNQSIAAIEPNESLHYEFVYQNLVKRYEELRMISSGDGTRGGLNKQIIADVIITSPNIEEQTKIGSFFKQLDDTIALHEQELDALKETKKAFLQKMFV